MRQLNFAAFIPLALVLGFAALPAQATRVSRNTAKPRAAVRTTASEPAGTPKPVDTFIARLKQGKRPRQVKTLALAERALKALKPGAARSLVAPLQKDRDYGDHALWITAQAYFQEAKLRYEADDLTRTEDLSERAKNTLLQIPARFPYSPWFRQLPRELAQVELLKGDTAWLKDKWSDAQIQFESAFQRLQVGSSLGFVEADNLRHYGESCAKAKGPLCQAWLTRFYAFLPRHCGEMTALLQYAPKLAEQSKKPPSPYKATQAYKKSIDLDQDAFDAAMLLELAGKHGDSVKALRAFQSEFPKSTYRYRARFWLAQSLRRDGDSTAAKAEEALLAKESPFTFYGLMAALSDGDPIDAALTSEKPVAIDTDPFLAANEIVRIHRAEALIGEGAKVLPASDLRDLRARDPIQSRYLMYLAELNNEVADYSTSFSILSELIQRGYERIYSLRIRDMIFPTPFLTEIRMAAKEADINPILLLSLVKQESAFDADSASSTGAFGLTQLMYGTAAEVLPGISRVDLQDPATNLKVGARYLRQLLRRVNGNIALALAGYNAGPYAADRWIKSMPSGQGLLEFLETIPYKETREYVAGIIRNYYWYSKILGEPLPKNPAYFWGQGAPVPEPHSEPSLAIPYEEETSPEPSALPSPQA